MEKKPTRIENKGYYFEAYINNVLVFKSDGYYRARKAFRAGRQFQDALSAQFSKEEKHKDTNHG